MEASDGENLPLLLSYDGSEDARHAIAEAATLTRPRTAVVLHVWRPPSALLTQGRLIEPPHPLAASAQEFDAAAEEEAAAIGEEGVALAREAGLDAVAVSHKVGRTIWPAIIEAADERDARLIVVGSRGRSRVRGSLLGSVSQGVVHHSRRPVLVVTAPSGAAAG